MELTGRLLTHEERVNLMEEEEGVQEEQVQEEVVLEEEEEEVGGLGPDDRQEVRANREPAALSLSLLSPCLEKWRDNADYYGSLSNMLHPTSHFLLQVIGITLDPQGKATGEVVVHDSQCYTLANMDSMYLKNLAKRDWGMYSILKVMATSGLPGDLTLDKVCHPKSVQLTPRRSLVTPTTPLRPLLPSMVFHSSETTEATDLSLASVTDVSTSSVSQLVTVEEGGTRRIKDLLPATHCAQQLCVSPALIRKKLSHQQVDNVVTMMGQDDFIK